jgi:tRNA (guanine-N7-)-methyltransferase
LSKKVCEIKQLKDFNPEKLPRPASNVQQHVEGFLRRVKHRALDFEIGCGVGLHPIQYATQNPERFLIATEHTHEKFEKFSRRFEKHQSPTNLLPIHGNAISVAHYLIPEQSLDRCFLLYPNPNPKNLNQRWHAMPFMQRILQLLKPDGELIIATNEEFYALEAIEWMKNYWQLEVHEERMTQSSHSAHLGRTHFERKYLSRGEVCYNLIFKRK